MAAPAPAAVAHVVQPGETLWSIAAANDLTTRTVAAYNGLSEDAQVIAGTTIDVPTVDEGAAALAAAGITPGSPSATGNSVTPTTRSRAPSVPAGPPASTPPPFPYATIPSPSGDLYLDAGAAASWESMRAQAISDYGVDLYPGGPLSAYRSYAQQSYLYELFRTGQGERANPPGSSTHELGIAVDLATPEMRSVVDAIGPYYCWYPHYDSEWWHVEFQCY
jgi:murein DD-endopeptidase MepM/ murein hydrolase activator NlpD